MLIVLLVTPWSVVPVACPLPHGEGSVPNFVVEMEDEAPVTEGEVTTPVAVSAVRSSANATARIPRDPLHDQPPGVERRACTPRFWTLP